MKQLLVAGLVLTVVLFVTVVKSDESPEDVFGKLQVIPPANLAMAGNFEHLWVGR